MYFLNLVIHNFHDDNVHMYIWDETIIKALRGSQEIGLCILKHLQNLRNQKYIIVYSDICSRQNRNIKVALISLKIVQTVEHNVEVIDPKFLISGYSFLPNDEILASLMSLKKNNLLFVPQYCYNVIKKYRKGNNFI